MKQMIRILMILVVIMLVLGLLGCRSKDIAGGPTIETGEDDVINQQQAVTEMKSDDQIIEILLNGKKPEDLSLEEYNRLSPDEKAVFPDCFGNMEQYEEWYCRVVGQATEVIQPDGDVMVDLGGKEPQEFTLEEYNKLSTAEKAFFPDCFNSMQEYYSWYSRVVGNSDSN